MTFGSLQPTPICLEKFSGRKGINFNILTAFTVPIWLEEGKICKNNDHTCMFHCINIFWFPPKMFEHSAYQPRVQTASSGRANVNA